MRTDPPSASHYLPAKVQAALDRMEGRGQRWWQHLGLAFGGDLEQGFLRHRAESVLMMQRLVIVLGMVFYGTFLLFDGLTAKRFSDPLMWGTLMAFALPGNLALLSISFLDNAWRYNLTIARMGAWFHTFGLLLVASLAAHRGVNTPFEFLVIQLIYDFFLLGLIWTEASVLAMLTLIATPALMAVVGLPQLMVLETTFLMAMTTLLGGTACYMQERSQRLTWLKAQVFQTISERDGLTGLLNHRSFYSRSDGLIRQARREGRPVALLVIDIDHFKRFNDVYGHLAGDECLRRVAHVVQDHARRPLDLVARLGGEEFAVFLYDTSRASALSVAEDLREAVKKVQMPGKISVTVSIGATTTTAVDTRSMEELVGNADVALYRAKNDQRDCVREWSNEPKPKLQLVGNAADSSNKQPQRK